MVASGFEPLAAPGAAPSRRLICTVLRLSQVYPAVSSQARAGRPRVAPKVSGVFDDTEGTGDFRDHVAAFLVMTPFCVGVDGGSA